MRHQKDENSREWLREHGGFCDCEVIYNVGEKLAPWSDDEEAQAHLRATDTGGRGPQLPGLIAGIAASSGGTASTV